MRIFVFVCGATIVAMGLATTHLMSRDLSMGFFQGALTLGGGILICGLFSLKMPWHGLIGAGVLALLGAARGLGNLPGIVKFVMGERLRGSLPVFEFGVMVICVLLLMRIIRTLRREHLRRMLESEE
ncbi:MAG: hypothetical protein ABI162_13430 [Luteolibacter sp.]